MSAAESSGNTEILIVNCWMLRGVIDIGTPRFRSFLYNYTPIFMLKSAHNDYPIGKLIIFAPEFSL